MEKEDHYLQTLWRDLCDTPRHIRNSHRETVEGWARMNPANRIRVKILSVLLIANTSTVFVYAVRSKLNERVESFDPAAWVELLLLIGYTIGFPILIERLPGLKHVPDEEEYV